MPGPSPAPQLTPGWGQRFFPVYPEQGDPTVGHPEPSPCVPVPPTPGCWCLASGTGTGKPEFLPQPATRRVRVTPAWPRARPGLNPFRGGGRDGGDKGQIQDSSPWSPAKPLPRLFMALEGCQPGVAFPGVMLEPQISSCWSQGTTGGASARSQPPSGTREVTPASVPAGGRVTAAGSAPLCHDRGGFCQSLGVSRHPPAPAEQSPQPRWCGGAGQGNLGSARWGWQLPTPSRPPLEERVTPNPSAAPGCPQAEFGALEAALGTFAPHAGGSGSPQCGQTPHPPPTSGAPSMAPRPPPGGETEAGRSRWRPPLSPAAGPWERPAVPGWHIRRSSGAASSAEAYPWGRRRWGGVSPLSSPPPPLSPPSVWMPSR